ncbi:hypothetical protein GOBAR_AA18592 [Gossypium barbadense]|uniref:PhoD-like phosphatase metallophosphatase domain-containing protein n=1 Tax=Gossypium barbadense TaxID=3634 RepID=A0A2P5XFE0_GOSBA|nr:hypothetical protein GOBAR_AA18592 [Gossypium barbadense]
MERLVAAVLAAGVLQVLLATADDHYLLSRIAFGPCANQNAPQPIWDAINKFDPQVFIWLGDNIYGDIRRPFNFLVKERTIGPWKNAPRFIPSSSSEMLSRYNSAKNVPDTRYHRDPLSSDGSVLGDSQWSWLGKELRGPPSAITIIGSSIQVISNLSGTTGPLFYMESWGRFPKERDCLFKLINDSKRDGVFFISGDVHFGEITRYDCAAGYPLYDITSSGLIQAVEKVLPSPLRFIVRFLAWFTPSTMRVKNQNCRYRSCTYGEPNFGAIQIDWDASPVNLKIQVRDINGLPVTGVDISLSELQAWNRTIKAGQDQRHCTLEVKLPWIVRYRLAILVYSVLACKQFLMLLSTEKMNQRLKHTWLVLNRVLSAAFRCLIRTNLCGDISLPGVPQNARQIEFDMEFSMEILGN